MGSQELTFTGWFILFFPEDYIENDILPNTNTNTNKNIDMNLSLGEFLRYIGIWLFIANHPAMGPVVIPQLIK